SSTKPGSAPGSRFGSPRRPPPSPPRLVPSVVGFPRATASRQSRASGSRAATTQSVSVPRSTLDRVSTPTGAPNADELQPIRDGAADSDYERYLRTDELVSIQKGPDEWVHRDELLFQTVHQSSELWLKHACAEIEEATRLIEARDIAAALRLLFRANRSM